MKRAQSHLLNLLIAPPLLVATTNPLAGQQVEGTRGNLIAIRERNPGFFDEIPWSTRGTRCRDTRYGTNGLGLPRGVATATWIPTPQERHRHENCTYDLRHLWLPPQVGGVSPPGPISGTMTTANSVRSRLRFDSLEHVTTPDGSGRVSVRLEWGGEFFEGTVSCLETQQGILKAASQAALSATLASTESFSDHGIDLEVVGVKAVRAFDGWVVVTRVNGKAGADSYRLLGAAPCEAEEDLPGAAVKAVLNASNRVMEQRVAR